MLKPSTLFKILFVCVLFISCDDEPLEGDFVTSEDVMDDDDSDGDGDDDTNNDPDNQVLLVSQIVAETEGEPESFTINYTYDSDNRVLREDFNNGSLTYGYQNSLLVETVLSFNNSPDDIIETYTYDNQERITSFTIEIANTSNTSNLVYSSDNTIIEGFDPETNQLQSRITLSNGNIIQFEEFLNNEVFYSDIMTYDNMVNVHNGTNLSDTVKFLYSENLPSSPFTFGNNNVLTSEFIEDGETLESYSFSYTYNEEGYPITAIETYNDNGETEIINYTITYIPAN